MPEVSVTDDHILWIKSRGGHREELCGNCLGAIRFPVVWYANVYNMHTSEFLGRQNLHFVRSFLADLR